MVLLIPWADLQFFNMAGIFVHDSDVMATITGQEKRNSSNESFFDEDHESDLGLFVMGLTSSIRLSVVCAQHTDHDAKRD
jgi:hypothetical protein